MKVLGSVLVWNKLDIPIVTYCHYPALWANNMKLRIPEIDQSLNAGNLGNKIVFDSIVETITSKDIIGYSLLFNVSDGISDIDEE